jgi:CheY-like chemotaxis protein
MQEPSSDELEVLLIEDNPADARLVQALLADSDTLVITRVETLEAGLEQLRTSPFDAVLLDLLLPDARGVDLIAKVRAAAPSAAVVVLGGQAADDLLLAQAIVRKGAEDVVPKGELTTGLLERSLTLAVERVRQKAAAERREAALAGSLAEARIGHWSWSAGSRTVRLAGYFPGLADTVTPSGVPAVWLPVQEVLRRLPRWARQSLHAARREVSTSREWLALVVAEADATRGGGAGELVIEAVLERDGGGRICRMDGTVRDAAGAGAVEQLEAEMITQLGHELRTPLTTIRGVLGLLANGDGWPLAGPARMQVATAIASADRLGGVIGDLLQRGGVRSASRGAQRRRVPLGPFLYDALAARLPMLTAAGIMLGLSPAGRAVDQTVDAGRVRRAVDCLCRRLLVDCRAEHLGRRGFILDVVTHPGVAWLEIAPAPGEPRDAGLQDNGTDAVARNAIDCEGRTAWRAAFALAA